MCGLFLHPSYPEHICGYVYYACARDFASMAKRKSQGKLHTLQSLLCLLRGEHIETASLVPVKYHIFPSVWQLREQCPNKSVILGPALHDVQLQLVTTSYLFGRQGEGAHVGTWSASWYGSSRCPAPRWGWWRRQNHCPLWTGSCWLKCAC